jgi:acetyltransferase
MPIETRRLSADDIRREKAGLVELLRDVVDNGASVNFIAPLDSGIAAAYWERVAGEVEADARIVMIAQEAGQIVGCVHLALATQPNGRHRAEVQKVLTHSTARRRGIATTLMQAIESEALAVGRFLLVLDTERDSSGEKLYDRVGYLRAGIIPSFAFNHDGSALIDTVLFYKLLE